MGLDGLMGLLLMLLLLLLLLLSIGVVSGTVGLETKISRPEVTGDKTPKTGLLPLSIALPAVRATGFLIMAAMASALIFLAEEDGWTAKKGAE